MAIDSPALVIAEGVASVSLPDLSGRKQAECSKSAGDGAKTLPQDIVNLPEQNNVQQIGLLLYGRNTGYYMFPFEIASLLLLVAVVGAVVMAKRRV